MLQGIAFRPSTAAGARKERQWARDARRLGDAQYWNSRASVHDDFCLDADFYVPHPFRWRRDYACDPSVTWTVTAIMWKGEYHRSGGQVAVCGNDTYSTACSECRAGFAAGVGAVTVERPQCPIRGDVCVRFAAGGK